MIQELLYLPQMRDNTLNVISLCKVKIAFFTALQAIAVFLFASNPQASVGVFLAAGIFLMAAGAGALNNVQERHTDALMDRTAGRPLPAGKIKTGWALRLSLFLIFFGCAVLLFTGIPWVSLLGLTAVFWYNCIYTWLKTYSGFAAVPGALVGVIPPAMGWVAGGGNIYDPLLAVLCFFFFMWQIMHFFIHIHINGRQYEKAGLPSLSSIFSEVQLDRISFQWLSAVVVSTQFIVLFGIVHSLLAHTAIIGASVWLAFQAIVFIRKSRNSYPALFRKINYYMLAIMLIMMMDGLFFHRFISGK